MDVFILPQVLRVAYPTAIFSAALLSLSALSLGNTGLPRQPQWNPLSPHTLVLTRANSCPIQDRLRLSMARMRCPELE